MLAVIPCRAIHSAVPATCRTRGAVWWSRPGVAVVILTLAVGATACTSASNTSASTGSASTGSASTGSASTGSASSGSATVSPTSSSVPVPTPAGSASSSGGTASPSATPTARSLGLEPQVGPLFAAGDVQPHGCSASVVHSPGHDLIITAAHCINGNGSGQLFAPDYRDGGEPFGTWRVLRAWASAGWVDGTDPHLDVAVLQVAPQRIRGHLEQVEDLVGAETLGTTAPAGARVTVVGYTHGIDDRQITCTNVLTRAGAFPAFSCHGYVGGTSGSPFLTDARPRVIVGLVGGRDEGGCTEAVSYSPPFGPAVAALLARAAAGDHPDSLPAAASDC